MLASAGKMVMVEANYSGQFEKLLKRELGIDMAAHIRKYNGEPFYPLEIEKGVLGIRKEVHALA